MSRNFRVRTEVGKEKKLTFEIKQDFDLLEILSLSLTQNDIYTRMCSDFGVVVGRVIANKGYGIPNAKISIFIPLDDKDSENKVITSLYPYTEPFQKDENGIRYNLLSSERSHSCHVPVGTFPRLQDVLDKQQVRHVYEKYYKFTAKTNDAGDFMIYGVPTGNQSIVMDIDLSDIGCFSLLPEDFKIQGFSESEFDGPKFKTDTSLDRLPQIKSQIKNIEVSPFWGDEEFCNAAITRVDFDLADNNFSITPTAVFMGGTATDTEKNSVNRTCKPKRDMGELCSLVTQTGLVDCIRYTPFYEDDPAAFNGVGGLVPILQRYYLPNGGRVIEENGTFFCSVEMNLDHVITDEFGMLVKSGDPTRGVPTRARCRFRIRANKSSSGQQVRSGNYLVPNIREYNTDPATGGAAGWRIDSRSYNFSTRYSDYHPYAQQVLMPGAKDVFYDMHYNKVYTPSVFHDKHKQFGRQQFLAIKEILPEAEQQCSTSAMFFPINSAVRKPNFMVYLMTFLLRFLGGLYGFLIVIIGMLATIIGMILTPFLAILGVICTLISFWNSIHVVSWGPPSISLGVCDDFCWGTTTSGNPCTTCFPCRFFGLKMGFILFTLRQTKYPECEKCSCRTNVPNCGTSASFAALAPSANNYNWGGCDCGDPICEGSDGETICCPDDYGFNSECDTPGTPEDFLAGGGCYVKLICFNPGCGAENMNTRIITEWRKREQIAVGLCNGIMNYFWENNWVNGFLYQYQFKARLEYDEISDTYTGEFCDLMIYLHPNDHIFYYRSTPFDPGTTYGGVTPGIANITNFTYANDGAASHSWLPSWLTGVGTHAEGDTDRHILTPTTIVDYGPRSRCIQEICLDDSYSEGCSIVTQLGSTSFQDITDLVSDIYNLKVDGDSAVLTQFFPRPEKRIGGDVAQAIMQNCMVGTIGYETNIGSTSCDCAVSPVTAVAPPATGYTYPIANPRVNPDGTSNGNPYVKHALNTRGSYYTIDWEPKIYTGSTPGVMSTKEIVDCLYIDLSATTQTVPYYTWWNEAGGFGGVYNDWQYMTGDYTWWDWSNGFFTSFLILPTVEKISWTNTVSPRYSGPYQNDIANIWWAGVVGYPDIVYPPLTQNSYNQQTVFSQPRFHYFGLRPGETAYNTFIRRFVDEELADSVL